MKRRSTELSSIPPGREAPPWSLVLFEWGEVKSAPGRSLVCGRPVDFITCGANTLKQASALITLGNESWRRLLEVQTFEQGKIEGEIHQYTTGVAPHGQLLRSGGHWKKEAARNGRASRDSEW